MFKRFFKIAFRNIFHNQAYALVNILGLSIGFTVFLYILMYTQHELSFDKFHEGYRQSFRVEQTITENGQKTRTTACPAPLAVALKEEFPQVTYATRALQQTDMLVNHEGINQYVRQSLFVDPDFLHIFNFPLLQGEAKEVLEDPYSAVLTTQLADKLFPGEAAIGQRITVGNRFDCTVTGVVQAPPTNTHLQFSMLVSLATFREHYGGEVLENWSQNWMPTYIHVAGNTDKDQLEANFTSYLKNYQGQLSKTQIELRHMHEIHLYSQVQHELGTNSNARTVYIFLFIGIFVLLIASINFMNLSTAYANRRATEVAIRKVVGSSRRQLIIQFLGEALIMAAVSMLLALLLVELVHPYLNEIVNRALGLDRLFRPGVILSIVLAVLLAALVAGLHPAFVLSMFSPGYILRNPMLQGKQRPALQNVLVVMQFFISITLIIMMFTVLQQLNYLNKKDLGFARDHILHTPLQSSRQADLGHFLDTLQSIPGIAQASAHDFLPSQTANYTAVTWQGLAGDRFIKMNVNYCDTNFLGTYQIKLLAGRNFSSRPDTLKMQEVILNKTAAGVAGWEDAIGQRIYYQSDYRMRQPVYAEVVGVVDDFHFLSLHDEISPMMLRPLTGAMSGVMCSMRLRPGPQGASLKFIAQQYKKHFPDLAYSPRWLDKSLRSMYENERATSQLVSTLAFIALIVASTGLFGLVSFVTQQRTKEIGIRKALGFPTSHIFLMLIRKFALLLAIAAVAAMLAGYFLARFWLHTFPYHTGLTVWPFAGALVLTALIAFSIVAFKAWRAARATPAESLIYE